MSTFELNGKQVTVSGDHPHLLAALRMNWESYRQKMAARLQVNVDAAQLLWMGSSNFLSINARAG